MGYQVDAMDDENAPSWWSLILTYVLIGIPSFALVVLLGILAVTVSNWLSTLLYLAFIAAGLVGAPVVLFLRG